MEAPVSKRNPNSPANPAKPADVSPKEYERQVVNWLRAAGTTLEQFEVQHLKHLGGAGGDYEFDAVAKFTILSGAEVVVLVECKRYSQPVEREKVLSLWAKLQDVKAHKAMMFATCGFQSGALEYAKTYRIATIAFVEGAFLYETKALGPTPPPPSWANLPEFTGILMRSETGKITCSTIDVDNTQALSEWLKT
jgi:restriction system protein